MKLMIVESPNKVKKIEEMLGAGWKVMASVVLPYFSLASRACQDDNCAAVLN